MHYVYRKQLDLFLENPCPQYLLLGLAASFFFLSIASQFENVVLILLHG